MADKEKQKISPITWVLLLITVAALCVTVWAVFFRDGGDTVLTPDYAPKQEEQNAKPIEGDSGEKLEKPEGGGSVSLTYAREVEIDLASKTASLIFANPGKSNQSLVVQIVIQDTVIVQSGTLKPGNQVETLDLIAGMEKKLAAGTYEGSFRVLYYDLETGEKAIVDTQIPITVTVK
jgi:hypothetical protein